jgi:hypothetical protein
MTDNYLTLTTFIPGTKAKADEVNANFTALKDAVNSKASLTGDNTRTFNVADATSNTNAVSKSQLDTQVANLITEIKKTYIPFCAKSGNVTNGQGDLFTYSGLTVTPKIGGAYANLVISDYKGLQTTITSAAALSMTGKVDGTYNIFIKPDSTLYAQNNTIYRQAARPTMIDGDVWFNTSIQPASCIKYSGGTDIEFLDVPLGVATVKTGAITSLTTNPFNQNGFSVNVNTFTQSLGTNGWTKLPNGLILQWGTNNTLTSSNGVLSINLPITFPNAFLNAQVANGLNSTSGSYICRAIILSNATIGLQTTNVFTAPYYWLAIGY